MAELRRHSPILFRLLILCGAVLIFLVIYFTTGRKTVSVPVQEIPSPVPAYPIHTGMSGTIGSHDRKPVYTFHAASYPDHPVNGIFPEPVFSVFDETKDWKLTTPRIVPDSIILYWIVPEQICPNMKPAFLMLGIKKYNYMHSAGVDGYSVQLNARKAILLLKEIRGQGLIPITAENTLISSNFFYGTGEEKVRVLVFFFFTDNGVKRK